MSIDNIEKEPNFYINVGIHAMRLLDHFDADIEHIGTFEELGRELTIDYLKRTGINISDIEHPGEVVTGLVKNIADNVKEID